jgi:hypothetical protein
MVGGTLPFATLQEKRRSYRVYDFGKHVRVYMTSRAAKLTFSNVVLIAIQSRIILAPNVPKCP